jgi:hypothetical protein
MAEKGAWIWCSELLTNYNKCYSLTNSSINHAWFPLPPCIIEGDKRLCPLSSLF